ncbi:AT-hook motif nuclear-localized protein 21 [Abeliophyllum distichum]|uniref:AT-hook motif nuclear-localized protein 21 n=1 Tax=Abeliophyllum distichum TaxID=126358 RepID=A0ABD1NU49_9LAMI
MAGLGLGSVSNFVSQLHLQRPPDSDDETNRNQFFGKNNDNSHQGLELGTSNTSSGDMGSRRLRGRPPVSKNKPTPLVIITREKVNSGCNVFEAMASYARKRQKGICILGGTGIVNNVTIRQPAATGYVVTLHGRFEIFIPFRFLPATIGASSYHHHHSFLHQRGL